MIPFIRNSRIGKLIYSDRKQTKGQLRQKMGDLTLKGNEKGHQTIPVYLGLPLQIRKFWA